MNETHPSIEHIVEYLHGELSPAEDAVIYAHLASCPDCEAKRTEEVAITEALRTYAQTTERDMPLGLATRIRSTAVQTQPGTWERLFAGFKPAVLLPAAAALAVAIYIGYGRWHSSSAPTAIAATSYVNNHAAMAAGAPFGDAAPPVTLTSDDATP